MAEFSINIRDLINTYFNVQGFILPSLGQNTQTASYPKQEIIRYDSNKRDSLGRPYFEPLEIDGLFIPVALFKINAKKRLITTPIVGRRGTVKEMIGAEDYQLNIQGMLINNEPLYPEDELMQLIDIYEKNEPLEVKNKIIEYVCGGMKFIIESLSTQATKHINVQPFTMRLVSDDEFDAMLSV